MMRNVERTKQRLLDAATAEFAERGLAGARIDRIADQAGVNKALIYAYYGNKEQLFGAALGAAIERIIHDVPIDAADLPGYAARRFDWQRAHPEAPRLMDWARLEGVETDRIPEIVAANELKLAAVARAQRDGVVSDRFTPAELLTLMNGLVMVGVQADADAATVHERRQSIKDAVRLLVRP
jgi:AcrR family transcriptional regulator